ncbi:type II toxin-antitoxin system RelE/ParE family toxin, partial [Neorhizobium galegae]|uniref:type II toxin-antitoxin system RelE/ParE family toxin n=1 Tax=Neorhizobium galegae TaxID=399 RepID=UPI0021031B9E
MTAVFRKLCRDDMTEAASVHRTSFDERLPWLAQLHTPEEDRGYWRGHLFATCDSTAGPHSQACIALRYTIRCAMIVSFRHKGLEAFYRSGTTTGLRAAHAAKLARIMGLLDFAGGSEGLNLPGLTLHLLKGNLKGPALYCV